MPGSVIVGGARTPMGRFRGGLSDLSATDLGSIAIAGALERAGTSPDEVEYVYMGQVVQAGGGQQGARAAAAGAGIPLSVPSATINKACLSGINTVMLADQLINAGLAEVVVAGGMESMTNAPHLLLGARRGFAFGEGRVEDSLLHDGLRCAFDGSTMGSLAERELMDLPEISRVRQDELARSSHLRALTAGDEGRLTEEIVPVTRTDGSALVVPVTTDEGPRRGVEAAGLAALEAAFAPGGSITPGNASPISDGAAAVVVMSPRRAAQLGLTPLGEILGSSMVAGPGTGILRQGGRAAARLLEGAGLEPNDVDLYEINEAFAAAVLASTDDLGVSHDRVNVNGGAIALGHPIGMSGTRLVLTLLLELRRRGGGTGVAALCGGGGQGDAMLVRAMT